MSIATNLDRIIASKDEIKNAIISKGVTVLDSDKIDVYADKIYQIQQGTTVEMQSLEVLNTGEYVNTVKPYSSVTVSDEVFYKKFIDEDGNTFIINEKDEIVVTYTPYVIVGKIPYITTDGLTAQTRNNTGLASLNEMGLISNKYGEVKGYYNFSKEVTNIGNYAFSNCQTMTSIELPTSLKTIGDYSFSYCSGFTEMTFPSGVTDIGNYTFLYCDGLTRIDFPTSLKTIGISAFQGCSGLTEITIPSGITYIGVNAFVNCTNLKKLIYGNGTTKTLKAHTPLITEVVIPNTVNTIGESTFSNCGSLSSVTIPSGVTTIGREAFRYCSGLTRIDIPDLVTIIDRGTFYGCSNLERIEIGSGVTSIGVNAFGLCKNIKRITIPSGVTSIEEGAFSSAPTEGTLYCYKEWYDNLNDTLRTNLGNVYNWRKVWIDEQSVYEIWYTTSDGNIVDFRESAFIENVVDNIYEDGKGVITFDDVLTTIGYSAFTNTSLTSIEIPNSVTTINGYTFGNCTSLTSVTIPNSVTNIGGRTFIRCSSLTSVTIPDSVTSIGNLAFYECTSLTSLTIPSGVTSIPQQLASSCYDLSSVTIPNSVTSIGNNAFNGCQSLSSVTIGSGVTSIGGGAFLSVPKQGTLYCYKSWYDSLTNVDFIKNMGNVYNWDKVWLDEPIPPTPTPTTDEYYHLTIYIPSDNEYSAISSSYLLKTDVSEAYFDDEEYGAIRVMGEDSFYLDHRPIQKGTNHTIKLKPINPDVISGQYSQFTLFYPNGGSTFYLDGELILPEGLITLKKYFYDGYGLTKLTLPSTVTSIGNSALQSFTKLIDITYNGTKAQFTSITKGTNWKDQIPTSCIVHCTDGDYPITDFN